MIIKQAYTGGKKIIEAKWNELIIYVDKTSFGNYTWEWNPVSEDYPNEADSTMFYHLKRNLLGSSTKEYLTIDNSEPETNVYRVTGSSTGTKMYFSFDLPAHTTVEIEGLLQGYDYYAEGKYKVYLSSTVPTSASSSDTPVATLASGTNIKKTMTTGIRSAVDFNKFTTTLTNDTDNVKTYYVVLYISPSGSMSNYVTGLAVKYLKFTKI